MLNFTYQKFFKQIFNITFIRLDSFQQEISTRAEEQMSQIVF